MKLRFDANLQYQQQAISAVVGTFQRTASETVALYCTDIFYASDRDPDQHAGAADVDGYIHVKDGHREPPRTHRRRDTGKSPGGAAAKRTASDENSESRAL